MRVIFLGTGGGRFVVFKQLRATGGLWIDTGKKNMLIDPGPCSLLRIIRSKRNLKISHINYIILTHRHLDHSADVNTIIEALTEGGFKRRGVLVAPLDALEDDPVVLRYLRGFLEDIVVIKEGLKLNIDEDITLQFSRKLVHPVETYGLNFYKNHVNVLSIISDTEYYKGIEEDFCGKTVIMNVVTKERKDLKHLSLEDVKEFLNNRKPDTLILTHFGMTMIKAKPWIIAGELSKTYQVNVIAARDGMEVEV